MEFLLFIAIITNAGGEGKTQFANALAAILRLLGYGDAIMLDGDPGNWASSVLNEDARRVGWDVSPGKATAIADEFVGRNVILDPGANAFAGSSNFLRLTQRLGEAFKDRGYRIVSFHPVSTNKVGALDSMLELAHDFQRFEQVATLVNRDGSDHYSGDLQRLERHRIVRVGKLQPGLIEVAALRNLDIGLAVTEPAEGFAIAGRYLGSWLANLASELEAADVLPDGSADAIRELTVPVQHIAYALPRASDCTDTNLLHLIWKSRVFRFLDKNNFSRAALLAAIEKFPPPG